jgi:hypothetical protein
LRITIAGCLTSRVVSTIDISKYRRQAQHPTFSISLVSCVQLGQQSILYEMQTNCCIEYSAPVVSGSAPRSTLHGAHGDLGLARNVTLIGASGESQLRGSFPARSRGYIILLETRLVGARALFSNPALIFRALFAPLDAHAVQDLTPQTQHDVPCARFRRHTGRYVYSRIRRRRPRPARRHRW